MRIIILRHGHTGHRNAGILRNKQMPLGRVHKQSSFNYITLQTLSSGNYIVASKQQISYAVLQLTLSQGLKPIKHAAIVSD